MELEFTDTVFVWRGPAPYNVVRVPEDEAEEIRDVAAAVTYGWGMIPVAVTVGGTTLATALGPKDGSYVVPLKDAIRKPEGIGLGDVITVRLQIDV